MTKKRHQAQRPQPPSFAQLPLFLRVAIYARVATQDQTKAQPRQVDDLISFAEHMGYRGECVKVYVDEGREAAAAPNERPGFQALLFAIGQDEVNALIIRAEDRLFTNAQEEEINAFILLCIEKRLLVITPTQVYDFQNLNHIALFRRQCVTAYQYIEETAAALLTRSQGEGK